MLPKMINESQFIWEKRDRLWEETWESMARMKAELREFKEFLEFMKNESRMDDAIANQPIVEPEPVRN